MKSRLRRPHKTHSDSFAPVSDRRTDWLLEPNLKGAHLINAEADLRAVLLHRFWIDQRRGWRLTLPNLEDLEFVSADYIALDELIHDESAFSNAPTLLKAATPEQRATAFRILLDHLRKGLAVNTASDASDKSVSNYALGASGVFPLIKARQLPRRIQALE
jgi:hypothetical protein